jgi:hypothetical protein
VPSDFCCGPSTACKPVAANTTLLCCPRDDKTNCATIEPISCDLTQQNFTLHPESALKTTALTEKLPACGARCCPFGYSCNSNKTCTKNANQQVLFPVPGIETISVVPSPSTSTTANNVESSPTSSGSPSGSLNAKHSISGGALAAAIIVPLCAVLAIGVFVYWWVYKKRWIKKDPEPRARRLIPHKAEKDASRVKDTWSRLEDPLELETQYERRTHELA